MKKTASPVISPQTENFEKTAARVTGVSIAGNLALSGFKLAAGLMAHSGAMVSDAVHSASDVFSSFVVIIGIKLSAKEADKEHPYGHERLECVAAVILSVVLLITGLFIGHDAAGKIASGSSGAGQPAVPGLLALAAAVLSIIAKEAMFRYTKVYALRIDSSALMADAWHHRSDALSSVGALAGIAGARLGFPLMDPAASIVICVFIAKAAIDIFRDAVGKMIDRSCDDNTQEAIRSCALSQDGVMSVDFLQTRVFGNKIYVDIEIGAEGSRPLSETHAVAEQVHAAIEQQFSKVKHIMVHVNPYKGS